MVSKVLVIRILATVLLAVTLLASLVLISGESLAVSRRLAAAIFVAPLVSWGLAFFGGALGDAVGLPSSSHVDGALRLFGLLVLVAISMLLLLGK